VALNSKLGCPRAAFTALLSASAVKVRRLYDEVGLLFYVEHISSRNSCDIFPRGNRGERFKATSFGHRFALARKLLAAPEIFLRFKTERLPGSLLFSTTDVHYFLVY